MNSKLLQGMHCSFMVRRMGLTAHLSRDELEEYEETKEFLQKFLSLLVFLEPRFHILRNFMNTKRFSICSR